MADIHVSGWQWDEGNLRELRHQGLSRPIVLQVAQESPKFRKNTSKDPERGATYQMIGPDAGGALWVVCIVDVPRAAEADIWWAVTGWRADDEEIAWYRRWT
ncbi:MAG: hypothetical protein HY775_03810 [Acidobacteria bacterium]|nr:hypothetical protein [Acidobacteriota bacterium]